MKFRLFTAPADATDWGLLLLRVGLGGLMFGNHGLLKLLRLGQETVQFYPFLGLDPRTSLWLAAVPEAMCSLIVVAGLATRWAILPLLIILLVAIFGVLAGTPFAMRELATVFLIGFSTLLITGPGKFSLDAYRLRRRPAQEE